MLNTELEKWSVKNEKEVFTSRIFSILERETLKPCGKEAGNFYSIDSRDWVNIIPITKNNEVVLIKQYRHGIQDFTLEIPGGMAEKEDNDYSISALRELKEETGYLSEKLDYLGPVHNNPAIITNQCHLYAAFDCEKKFEQNLDDHEEIEIELYNLSEIPNLIRDGVITHSLVISAFYLLNLNFG